MSKAIAVLGSALFFVIAPLGLAGFVPWWLTHREFRPAFFGVDLTRTLGGMLIIVGATGVVDSFARFALEGLGTPAPIAPPHKLVVTGLYRHVRNPIYIAVVAVIFGQALLFGDWRLLSYGALLWLFFHVWLVMIEVRDCCLKVHSHLNLLAWLRAHLVGLREGRRQGTSAPSQHQMAASAIDVRRNPLRSTAPW